MHKRTKRARGQAHDILRAILEVAPIGIYIVNTRGNVDYVNSAMVVISGDTYEQFKSINVFELPPYKKLGLERKIRSVFVGDSFSAKSVKYTSYFSKKTTVRNFIGIPLEEEGEKKALIFVEDITQIKKAEEEMIRAMNIKSQFVSLVSHELRAPLGIIQMHITALMDRAIGELNKKQKDFLNTSKRNIDRLARLVHNVLDYQKLEAGRVEYKMERGDINDLVREVAKGISPLIKKKGLRPRVSLARDLPGTTFDRDKIVQVLTNFVNNAVKFTKKGSVGITSSKTEDEVCVSVSDTGMGIRKEDMHKLFQGFSQISHGKEQVPGTGLGLAISKSIIDHHDGKIQVRSEYGKGSTFSFLLPIK